MDYVISVENLGKKYLLSHHARTESYVALRDVISEKVAGVGRRLLGRGAPASRDEEFWALRDLSFAVKEGDRVGIIGHNGAGKSTLLKILSRIVEPTTGSARIRGRVASLLEVGTGFHPELTGRENIFLNGAILGMGRAEIKRKFDEIVDFADMERFLDTPVKRYSSGMYVRLAFAVAAHLEPEILIVDEVLAVGDVHFQRKCLGKMEDVATRQGRTVLFVSHNMAAISALCNRGLVLSRTVPHFLGGSGEAIDRYLTGLGEGAVDGMAGRNRRGNGAARVEDVFLVDRNGNRVELLMSGKPYEVVVRFTAHRPLGTPTFKISFYGAAGTLIAHFNNWLCNTMPHVTAGAGEARCAIPRLPLSAGVYSVNASMNAQEETLDHIEACLRFRVENGDFFGTGRVPAELKEVCLQDHSWSIKNDEGAAS